jgi:hypothetical protein
LSAAALLMSSFGRKRSFTIPDLDVSVNVGYGDPHAIAAAVRQVLEETQEKVRSGVRSPQGVKAGDDVRKNVD